MNPFLFDTVAQPLSELGSIPRWRSARKRRARAIAFMTVAGMTALSAHALDVNEASLAELQTIKGVGPRTAQIIIQERQRAGLFESLQDLSERVRGIGMKRLQSMQQAGLTVGSSSSKTAGLSISDNKLITKSNKNDKSGRVLPTKGGVDPVVMDVESALEN